MRALMNLIKNRHGVYHAQRRVPDQLQEAVAAILDEARATPSVKARQAWLKKSLRTKDLREANILAKPVLAEFDRIIAKAEARVSDAPLRTTLTAAEIDRMVAFHYASSLDSHDQSVKAAPDEERAFRSDMPDEEWVEGVPEFGLSGGQMLDARETLAEEVPQAEAALARGDIGHVSHRIDDVLAVFRVRLDTKGDAYRDLGLAILRSYVRVLRALAQRTQGEPIETPPLITPQSPATGEGLKAALKGWQKAINPAGSTLAEFTRAIELFTQLHGDLPVVQLRRSHVRAFREALQDVPHSSARKGNLRNAPLPELAAWGRQHPEVPKIANGTINKLLGGVQAVSLWARDNGFVPDEVAWSDPFSRARLEEEGSGRSPFDLSDLRVLFGSRVFTAGERPTGGRGEAAFWLPLLALFTGARLGELAQLTADDVQADERDGTPMLVFTKDAARGKHLKSPSAVRVVPVHPELLQLGWLEFVRQVREEHGPTAWLFPLISPQHGSGDRAWSKWFNRYLGDCGVTGSNKVFHSFRHGFTDALRAAGAREDVSKALVGHADGSVHGRYGAKTMLGMVRHV